MGRGGIATVAAVVVGSCGALVADPVGAAVVFDPATGTGFVEKADLQRAFGWTGATLQRNAPGVSFAVTSTQVWTARCEWSAGSDAQGGSGHRVTVERTSTVTSARVYEPRVKNQLIGFSLVGLKATTTVGHAPVAGATCISGSRHGMWTAVRAGPTVTTLFARHAAVQAEVR